MMTQQQLTLTCEPQSKIREIMENLRAKGERLNATDAAMGALLGQRCWVKYPYLQEALVHAISDASQKVGSLPDLTKIQNFRLPVKRVWGM